MDNTITLDTAGIAGTAWDLSNGTVDPDKLAESAVSEVNGLRAAMGLSEPFSHGGHALVDGSAQSAGGRESGKARAVRAASKPLSFFFKNRHGNSLTSFASEAAQRAFAECHARAANDPRMASFRAQASRLHHGRSRYIDNGSHKAINSVLALGFRETLPAQFELFGNLMRQHPDIGVDNATRIIQAIDDKLISGFSFAGARLKLEAYRGRQIREAASSMAASSMAAYANPAQGGGSANEGSKSPSSASGVGSGSGPSSGAGAPDETCVATAAAPTAAGRASEGSGESSSASGGGIGSVKGGGDAGAGALDESNVAHSESASSTTAAPAAPLTESDGARAVDDAPTRRRDFLSCTYGRVAGYRSDLQARSRSTGKWSPASALVLATAEAELQKLNFGKWQADVPVDNEVIAFLLKPPGYGSRTEVMAVMKAAVRKGKTLGGSKENRSCPADLCREFLSMYNAVQLLRASEMKVSCRKDMLEKYMNGKNATLYGMQLIWQSYARDVLQSSHSDGGVHADMPPLSSKQLKALRRAPVGSFVLTNHGYAHVEDLYVDNKLPSGEVMSVEVLDQITAGTLPPSFAFLKFMTPEQKAVVDVERKRKCAAAVRKKREKGKTEQRAEA